MGEKDGITNPFKSAVEQLIAVHVGETNELRKLLAEQLHSHAQERDRWEQKKETLNNEISRLKKDKHDLRAMQKKAQYLLDKYRQQIRLAHKIIKDNNIQFDDGLEGEDAENVRDEVDTAPPTSPRKTDRENSHSPQEKGDTGGNTRGKEKKEETRKEQKRDIKKGDERKDKEKKKGKKDGGTGGSVQQAIDLCNEPTQNSDDLFTPTKTRSKHGNNPTTPINTSKALLPDAKSSRHLTSPNADKAPPDPKPAKIGSPTSPRRDRDLETKISKSNVSTPSNLESKTSRVNLAGSPKSPTNTDQNPSTRTSPTNTSSHVTAPPAAPVTKSEIFSPRKVVSHGDGGEDEKDQMMFQKIYEQFNKATHKKPAGDGDLDVLGSSPPSSSKTTPVKTTSVSNFSSASKATPKRHLPDEDFDDIVVMSSPSSNATSRAGSAIMPPPAPSSVKKFKYTEVVRKKDERDALTGYECDQCRKWYEAIGEGYDRNKMVQACSRHRAKHAAPDTPPDYWQMSFPSSETQDF